MSTPARVPLTNPLPQMVAAETLEYLGYDPKRVETRALVLLANRYRLDPLLGEIELIRTGQKTSVYITRDGMLQIAHRSGELDGIEVLEERRNSENDGWTCYVQVWRKGCRYPFRYGAQCKDSEPQAKAGNGPAQALARAERRALRRAFAIPTDETFDPDDSPESPGPVSVSLPCDTGTAPGVGAIGQAGSLEMASGAESPPEAPSPLALEGYPLVGGLIGDRDWWAERARQAGVPAARVLTKARELALQAGNIEPPRTVEDLNADQALFDAVLAWLDDVSQEPF